MTTHRLPRTLYRLTEIALGITAIVAVLLLLIVTFVDIDQGVVIEFTPEADTYSLTSETWGTGTITSATGVAQFTETTTAYRVLAVVTVLTYAAGIAAALLLLRGILGAVANGTPFVRENVNRIRAIGVLIPVFAFVSQGLTWATSLIAMNEITAEGLHIEANLQPDLTYLFIGLVVVALAEAFNHGTALQVDADLTV